MEFFKKLFQGRINRRNYLIGNAILFLIGLILLLVLVVLLVFQIVGNSPALIIIALPFTGFCLVYKFSFLTRRAHDLGLSGYNVYLTELNYLFEKGEGKENKHGKPPKSQIDVKSLFVPEA